MPADARAILIDSNILIFASTPASEFHAAALAAINRLEESSAPTWISSQVVREYLVHMTRPDVLGTRTIADVLDQVGRLCSHFTVADDTERVRRELLELVRQFGVQGKKVHDANLAATCLAYGIPRLLTHNIADFQRFSSLIEIETI